MWVAAADAKRLVGLNALSGIGGVRTFIFAIAEMITAFCVLMPCRALEAFGRIAWRSKPSRPG